MRINSLVASPELKKEVATLSPEESHHLTRVLRIQSGQEIVLFDGEGHVAEAQVEIVSKRNVTARIIRRFFIPEPTVQIDLIQALPKPDRWNIVLQKAVELGAHEVFPILTQHTLFRPNEKQQARWEKIVINAAQQCEVRWLPRLHSVQTLNNICSHLPRYDLVLIGSLYDGAKPLQTILKGKTPKNIALFIGPEGDFTEQEVQLAKNAGAIPVSFGKRILRTETAAIFGLSVLAYEFCSD